MNESDLDKCGQMKYYFVKISDFQMLCFILNYNSYKIFVI